MAPMTRTLRFSAMLLLGAPLSPASRAATIFEPGSVVVTPGTPVSGVTVKGTVGSPASGVPGGGSVLGRVSLRNRFGTSHFTMDDTPVLPAAPVEDAVEAPRDAVMGPEDVVLPGEAAAREMGASEATARPVASSRETLSPERLDAMFDGASAAPAVAPPVEWWTVGEKRYGSTRELLAAPRASLHGQPAVYHYRLSPKPVNLAHDAASVVDGAASAAIGGMLVGGVLAFVAALADLLNTAATYSHYVSPYGLIMAVPAVLAGLAGAWYAARERLRFRREGEAVAGELKVTDGGLRFVSGGVDADLVAHAEATPVNTRGAGPRWYDAFLGIAAAAVFGGSVIVPLGPAILGVIGVATLSFGTNVQPYIGGAIAGFGAAAGVWLAFMHLPLAWAIGLTLGIPAVLGILLAPRVRSALALSSQLSAAKPWWSREPARPWG